MIKNGQQTLIALLAGCILPLAFQPVGFYWVAIVSPAVLLCLWMTAKPARAAWIGFWFGLGFYGAGASWVYVSIHHFGNQNIFFSALFTLLFVLALTSLIALQGYCLKRFFSHKILIAFPAIWVLFEWILSWIFTGFPWLYLGYSQTASWLSGYAPLFGVYGVSFMAALSSTLLYLIIYDNKKIRYIGLFALIWCAGFLLHQIKWTQPIAKPIQVSLIQGNVPQQDGWSYEQVASILNRYETLTKQHITSDLIVWPESAVPTTLQNIAPEMQKISSRLIMHKSTLIAGIPVYTSDGKFYNSAIAFGQFTGQYNKRHLVPFGEYIPLESLIASTLRALNIPISEIIPGDAKQPLFHINQVFIAPFVCYEMAFAELVRTDLPQANILLTITNDAWFGSSWAAAQHLQIGEMRSLETARPMLFGTNNGITAIINAHGKIIKTIPRFKTRVLTARVQGMQGKTPWIIWGSLPLLLWIFLQLGIAFYGEKRYS